VVDLQLKLNINLSCLYLEEGNPLNVTLQFFYARIYCFLPITKILKRLQVLFKKASLDSEKEA
jgi:hypothetical protein